MAGSGSWIGSKNTAWRDGHRRRPRSPRRSLRDREEIVGRNRAFPGPLPRPDDEIGKLRMRHERRGGVVVPRHLLAVGNQPVDRRMAGTTDEDPTLQLLAAVAGPKPLVSMDAPTDEVMERQRLVCEADRARCRGRWLSARHGNTAPRVVSGHSIRLGPRNDSIDSITIHTGEGSIRLPRQRRDTGRCRAADRRPRPSSTCRMPARPQGYPTHSVASSSFTFASMRSRTPRNSSGVMSRGSGIFQSTR